MTILYSTVEILANFVEVFILYRMYADMLKGSKKVTNSRINVSLSIFGTIIVSLCNHVSSFSYFTILILIFYASLSIYIVYRTRFLTIFIFVSFYILCLSCFDFLILSFVSTLLGGYQTFVSMINEQNCLRVMVVIVVKLLWIVIYKFSRKYLHFFSEKQNNLKVLLGIIIIGYASFVYLANQTLQAFTEMISGRWLFLIILFGSVFFATVALSEVKKGRMELNIAELRNQMLEEKYDLVNDIYSKNAKLYHDINKHLNIIYQLIEAEDVENAKQYIQEISRPMTKLTKVAWTGVDIIDMIINCEIEKMNERGIHADINAEFPKNTNLLVNDMCTILSNLLDNAIEATEKLDNTGMISLTMRIVNSFLFIKVKNRCCSGNNHFLHFPRTTKENKELHGWGLPSVLEIAERYNGTMKCIQKEQMFIVEVMLCFQYVDNEH